MMVIYGEGGPADPSGGDDEEKVVSVDPKTVP
jgi:hypothetical protein